MFFIKNPLIFITVLIFLFFINTAQGFEDNVCDKFHAGHHFRIDDDLTRNVDGLENLKKILKNYDVSNFNGILYQIDWGMIERSPDIYDWSRLDSVLALAEKHNKYIRIRVQDRTFWTGCNSKFLPAYIENEANYSDPKICYAKIWEKETMDKYISLLVALVTRYKNNPYFMGIVVEETVLDSISLRKNPELNLDLYTQLKRLAISINLAAPNIMFTQYINWPLHNEINHFNLIADNLVAMGGGGSIGWPDSVVVNANKWQWYQVARNYNTKLVIAPSVELTPERTMVSDSIADHENIYQMLTNDIKSHIIVWSTWKSPFNDSYFTNVVIPVVNKHNGEGLNTQCPFSK